MTIHDMNNDTLTRLQGVFESTFGELEDPITPDTKTNDVEDWDSITHVDLILGIEAEFGIRITSAEIAECTQVNKIIEVLGRHEAK